MILASRNPAKLREFAQILGPDRVEPLPEGIDLPPEVGETFVENALIKARAACAATGATSFADDSGLVVDELGGEPGVRSARYAGEGATDAENLEKLLGAVAESGGDGRARYVCAIALVDPDGRESVFEATCEGRITTDVRGEGGFGYDPAFLPEDTGPEDGRTMAELDPAEKHAISHRGKAATALVESLDAGR